MHAPVHPWRRPSSRSLALAVVLAAAAGGCSKDASPGSRAGAGSGGNPPGSGGAPSPGSGGQASGGAGPSAGSGGAVASGGGAGTRTASGGKAGTGSGGAASSGGAPGSGGAAAASGGASSGGLMGTASGGAGGGTGSGGAAGLGSLTITNLKIDPNPNMTLSCYVSWTSSEAANSEVQFGTGGYQLRIVDANAVTAHKVHVVGMHPETAYMIKAVSTSATATGSAEGTFTTGKVPANLPAAATLVTDQRQKMQPGWTLTNFWVGSGNAPGIIVIVDEDAIPVWYYVHGKTADQYGMTSTDWLPNGHVLIGNASAEPALEVDLEGNIIWTGPTGGTPAASHHTSKLSTGDYLIVRESNASARVEELSPDDKVVWTWDLYDHLKPKTTAADWCHLNAVSVDEANNFLYFNCRFQGLFKVNRTDKSIIWQMGAAIDDAHAGTVTYLPDNSARFNDSHDPEVHPDGTVLFYDNQGWSMHTGGEMNGSYHTRVVEYQLDETASPVTATLTWEFPGKFTVDAWYKNSWQTPIWGDADRLDNGDVLVTAGAKGAGTHTRIFEVTRAGEVVWAMEWPENNGGYRAARIAHPPATKLP